MINTPGDYAWFIPSVVFRIARLYSQLNGKHRHADGFCIYRMEIMERNGVKIALLKANFDFSASLKAHNKVAGIYINYISAT